MTIDPYFFGLGAICIIILVRILLYFFPVSDQDEDDVEGDTI